MCEFLILCRPTGWPDETSAPSEEADLPGAGTTSAGTGTLAPPFLGAAVAPGRLQDEIDKERSSRALNTLGASWAEKLGKVAVVHWLLLAELVPGEGLARQPAVQIDTRRHRKELALVL